MSYKVLCIYHGNCADGVAAAWAVRYSMGCMNLEFHEGVYGDAPPDVTGCEVIIVDFSYPREVLIAMAASALSILVIDHHESAERQLVDLPSNVHVVFDMTRSGSMLVWDYFNSSQNPNEDEPRPQLLRYVQDRDLWKFEMEGTREVMAAVFSYPLTIDQFDQHINTDICELRVMGRALERKQRRDIEAFIKLAAGRGELLGHDVPLINVPPMWASDVGHILAEGELFAVCYYDSPTGRVFSLRSAKDGMNVAEIAEQLGGGGHKHAAGFRLTGAFGVN